jgi:hypothetical protein
MCKLNNILSPNSALGCTHTPSYINMYMELEKEIKEYKARHNRMPKTPENIIMDRHVDDSFKQRLDLALYEEYKADFLDRYRRGLIHATGLIITEEVEAEVQAMNESQEEE